MPVVYKSFNYQTETNNKPVINVDSATKNQMDTIVSNFVSLFKSKHL